MEGDFTIIDNCMGQTELSLKTLKNVLERFSIEKSRGYPVKIYELRRKDEGGHAMVGFYLKNPNFDALIGESFWIRPGS